MSLFLMGISIVIPTLNEEKYIGGLLNSLSRQSQKDFEVIIVDGQSEDNTCKVALSYNCLLKIRVVHSDLRNVSYQRNLGASIALNDALIFLDADSIVEKRFLEKARQARLGTVKILPYKGHWYDHLFFSMINTTFGMIKGIRPSALGICIISNKKVHNEIGGFDVDMSYFEDIDYVRRASRRQKFSFLSNVKVYTSIRRFEEKGTKSTMNLWILSFLYNFFTGKYAKVKYFD